MPTITRAQLEADGDGLTTLADGSYTFAEDFVASPPTKVRAATSGLYGGWRVIKATSRFGVVVDLTGPYGLKFSQNSSARIMFVGIKFINGTLSLLGSDIRFWHCHFEHDPDVWVGQTTVYTITYNAVAGTKIATWTGGDAMANLQPGMYLSDYNDAGSSNKRSPRIGSISGNTITLLAPSTLPSWTFGSAHTNSSAYVGYPPNNGYYGESTGVEANSPLARRVEFYGCEWGPTSSNLIGGSSTGLKVVGCTLANGAEPWFEPLDQTHYDAFSASSNDGTSNFEFTDCDIEGRFQVETSRQPTQAGNAVVDCLVQDCWIHDGPSVNFKLNNCGGSGTQTRGMEIVFRRVRSWNPSSGTHIQVDYYDITGNNPDHQYVDGVEDLVPSATNYPNRDPYFTPSRGNYTWDDVTFADPGGTDPATTWRNTNIWSDWATYFDFIGDSDGGGGGGSSGSTGSTTITTVPGVKWVGWDFSGLTTASVAKDASVDPGDIILLFVAFSQDPVFGYITPTDSNWYTNDITAQVGVNHRMQAHRRVAGAETSYGAVVAAGTVGVMVVALDSTTFDATTPKADGQGTLSDTATTSPLTAAATATSASSLALAAIVCEDVAGGNTFTAPAGYTEVGDATAANGPAIGIFTKTVGAGAVAAATATSSASRRYTSMTYVFNPYVEEQQGGGGTDNTVIERTTGTSDAGDGWEMHQAADDPDDGTFTGVVFCHDHGNTYNINGVGGTMEDLNSDIVRFGDSRVFSPSYYDPARLADSWATDAELERLRSSIDWFLENNNVRQDMIILVGHGKGALTALAYSARYPDLVGGLILINPVIDITDALTLDQHARGDWDRYFATSFGRNVLLPRKRGWREWLKPGVVKPVVLGYNTDADINATTLDAYYAANAEEKVKVTGTGGQDDCPLVWADVDDWWVAVTDTMTDTYVEGIADAKAKALAAWAVNHSEYGTSTSEREYQWWNSFGSTALAAGFNGPSNTRDTNLAYIAYYAYAITLPAGDYTQRELYFWQTWYVNGITPRP